MRDAKEVHAADEKPDLMDALARPPAADKTVVGVQFALDGGAERELVRKANGNLGYRRPEPAERGLGCPVSRAER